MDVEEIFAAETIDYEQNIKMIKENKKLVELLIEIYNKLLNNECSGSNNKCSPLRNKIIQKIKNFKEKEKFIEYMIYCKNIRDIVCKKNKCQSNFDPYFRYPIHNIAMKSCNLSKEWKDELEIKYRSWTRYFMDFADRRIDLKGNKKIKF